MIQKVHIEFQRVQTWLFAVPRLRAMVGANTLLGEILREELPRLAKKDNGARWQLQAAGETYPGGVDEDPLKSHDDPAADAKAGILSRDGGHFEACFERGAAEFAKAAGALLRRELPGLRFRISIDDKAVDSTTVALSKELPVLAPCEWTGRGLASKDIRQGTEQAAVSLDVSRRHEAACRAEKGNAEDLASLLTATTTLGNLLRPQTFQYLAGAGYLALIHADGNGVGAASSKAEGEAGRAAFFHRNRVLLRRALHAAINTSCEDMDTAPLLLLMLGGDDVLVVCKAGVAFPFVVTLCDELARLQEGDGGDFNLTLGVGVVIARPTIPIHRLHEVAQNLTASAKRRFRGFTSGESRSVVDWAVYTASVLDDIEEMRRRDWLRKSGKTIRILSQRPVDVLGEGLGNLEGLLHAAGELEGAPRSQLRYLVEQLPKGKTLSELAFAKLSLDTQRALESAGVEHVWTDVEGSLMTPLLDLIELYEINRLGRTATSPAGAGMIGEGEEEAIANVQA